MYKRQFLLWALSSTSSDSFPFNDVENPLDETLLELADVLYERLDAAFESAPISDELASNWMMDRRLMEKEREPLPEIVPGAALPADVEHFLEAGKGCLLYTSNLNKKKWEIRVKS